MPAERGGDRGAGPPRPSLSFVVSSLALFALLTAVLATRSAWWVEAGVNFDPNLPHGQRNVSSPQGAAGVRPSRAARAPCPRPCRAVLTACAPPPNPQVWSKGKTHDTYLVGLIVTAACSVGLMMWRIL